VLVVDADEGNVEVEEDNEEDPIGET